MSSSLQLSARRGIMQISQQIKCYQHYVDDGNSCEPCFQLIVVALFVCLFVFNGISAQEGYFMPFSDKIKTQ